MDKQQKFVDTTLQQPATVAPQQQITASSTPMAALKTKVPAIEVKDDDKWATIAKEVKSILAKRTANSIRMKFETVTPREKMGQKPIESSEVSQKKWT